MPRNGSGVYSPTAGVPVVSGTTISSTAVNNVLDDLGDEITASLPVSGVAPMTGVLRVTAGTVGAPGLVPVGDTNTGIYSPGADQLSIATGGVNALTISATQTTTWAGAATFQAKAVGKAFDVDAITDVASASTTDIGAAATSEVRITGTTTITSFGTSNAGIRRSGRFAGALTLTHNGTSLILPGAANITTAANDAFEAASLGSGNWQVTHYQRAVYSPGDGNLGVLLTSGVVSGSSVIDLALSGTYSMYRLVYTRMKPATDGASLLLRFSTNGGSSYVSTGYIYTWLYGVHTSATPLVANQTSTGIDTAVLIFSQQENSAGWGGFGDIYITPPVIGTVETATSVDANVHYVTSGGDLTRATIAGGVVADPPTHVRLVYSSGNIADGVYKLYGIP